MYSFLQRLRNLLLLILVLHCGVVVCSYTMPSFRFETNVSAEKVTDELLDELVNAVASALGKPKQYVVVHIVPDQKMKWGDSQDPCGLGTLMSIGRLGVAENKKISAVLYGILEKKLGISPKRVYITYEDKPSSEVGYNGSTWHDILG